LKRFKFYFTYAWRSVLRGGQRSFFAVLCVAVGVAALVALQALGSSIQDTMTGDTKAQAGGDIVLRISSSRANNTSSSRVFTTDDQNKLNTFKSDGVITEWSPLIVQSNIRLRNYFSFPPTLYAVDPATYPLYGNFEIIEPKGKNLRELIGQPGTVVVSKNLWEKLGLKLGQDLEVSGSNGQNIKLKVTGKSNIVLPGVILGPGQFFGYMITSIPTSASMYDAADNLPSQVFAKTPSDKVIDSAKQTLTRGTRFSGDTAYEIQTQLTKGISITQDFLSYIGLLSLLVGGIGVINTMLVVIGRRTTEIATVKALGLKTRQTLFIFTLEALFLGIMGSVLGVILGELLGLGIKGVAEGFFARPLVWSLYPRPIIVGMLVGVITSGVFGFLPSYAAARVRPAVVLRAQSTMVPRIGGIPGFIILLLMTLALGIIAGVLINELVLGVIIAFITLVLMAVLVGLLWVIILLFGLLPTPRNPAIKMAVRSFSRNRGRTATTVMVMVVGLFFISFITFVADSVKSSIREAFDIQLGYNTIGFTGLLAGGNTPEITANNIASLKQIQGMQKVFPSNFASVRLEAINGNTPPDGRSTISLNGRAYINGESTGNTNTQKIAAGRNLTPEDADRNLILISKNTADSLGVKPGDKLIVRPQSTSGQPNQTTELEVVGIAEEYTSFVNFEGSYVAPYNVVAKLGTPFTLYYMLIDRPFKQAALQNAQAIVPTVLDLDDLLDTFNRLLDQILAFPLILSLLSLFSGAILVANNVALAVLERRTEIGVLKAVGAKRKRVMGILLWESGLVGFLGGLIGVGAGIILALNVNRFSSSSSGGRGASTIAFTWSPGVAALLMLLGIGLALVATLISAWGAVQEKPLVVLRYE